jgi:tetratricopeptide (TPR) repeat protein
VYGQLLFRVGLRDEAEAAFAKAIGASPEPWRLRHRLAKHLRDAGDDSAAVGHLELSLRERREDPAVAEMVAALIAIGRYDEAIILAREATVAGPARGVLDGLAGVADSARAAGAQPGEVRVRLHFEDTPVGLPR